MALLCGLVVPDLAETEASNDQQQQSTNKIYRVTGDTKFLGDWNPADDRFIMEETAPGVYELVLENIPKTSFCMPAIAI